MPSDVIGAGPPARSAYHHGDLRAHLVAAVSDLVETHGPDGFSVAEAARRAGVSSAAPYKHFRDRAEILRAVAMTAMDQLRADMVAGAAAHPEGSAESVAGIGMSYIRFARTRPGVFRLTFSLTEGHDEAPELLERGQDCLATVAQAVARCMGLPPDAPAAQARAYMLWCFVHGHAFLTIDRKIEASPAAAGIDDWAMLTAVVAGLLRLKPPG
ncbi:MAG TPA: TetR/AcrR family transcriptional regulator [Paracoccaceae bacterium]|nr:TetR/AcrR family transcriptional regulator [Paracoccaceae bacterium]HMO71235.1 TetR/AcrR family transcriptional regulator [Paracoccaceae bacterium]